VDFGYDGGANLVWITPTGSGASPWTQRFNLKPQFHGSTPDTDAFNRTAVEKDGSTHAITRESDYLGLSKRTKYGDYGSTKGEVDSGYDKFLHLSRLQSNEVSPALDITLSRDFMGNILSKDGNTYGYDGMNRLVGGEGEATSYDEVSNLSVRGTKRYSYQSAGEEGESQMRLESFDDGSNSFIYGYDNNGNVVSISDRFDSLVYDTMNRLREVSYHGSSQLDRYWYDAAGLRVRREERINVDANTTKIYSLYGGENQLVQEKYVGSTRISTRFNIIEGGQILAQYEYVYGTGEVARYFYLDQIGSRRVVKDGSRAVTDKFSYSAWGEKTHTQGAQGELASYTGKEYDATGLLYFNARYYDPTIGRFITEDPSRKGTGWYTYCENNPINRTDPTGLQSPPGPVQDILNAPPTPNESWGYGPQGELLTVRYTTREVTVEEGLRILEKAEVYKGTPYEPMGNDRTGIDCSGLVTASVNEAGIPYKHTPTAGMASSPQLRIVPKAEARAGDVFLFPEGHTGFYNPNSPDRSRPYLSAISPDTDKPPKWEPGVGYASMKTMPSEPTFFRVQIQITNW
jgi:RHS repeat-associated protein